jgi:DNA primase
VEKLLIRELVAHPDIITHSSIDELLAFVVHNDVKRYVLRLKELIYEIDESDYSSVMGAIVNNGNYPIGLKEAVGGALFRYQPVSLDDKVLNKLTSDLKNRLLLEQLKQKRDDLKKRQKMCDTEEDLAQLMRELLFVQQDIEKLKSM